MSYASCGGKSQVIRNSGDIILISAAVSPLPPSGEAVRAAQRRHSGDARQVADDLCPTRSPIRYGVPRIPSPRTITWWRVSGRRFRTHCGSASKRGWRGMGTGRVVRGVSECNVPFEREVEVPDELQEVRVFLHHDGLVPILEEVAPPAMAAVEGPGVAREERAHAAREGPPPGADQEMRMVREEGPGIQRPGPLRRQRGQARDKVRPVGLVPEERGPLDPPHHPVVQGVRRIEPRLAGHSTAESTTRRQKMARPVLHTGLAPGTSRPAAPGVPDPPLADTASRPPHLADRPPRIRIAPVINHAVTAQKVSGTFFAEQTGNGAERCALRL